MEKSYGKLWVKGDWNGFFGLFTNILTNVLVLAGLLVGAVNMPENIVYGRIIPAVGLAHLIGNLYYAFAAKRLANKEKRDDVTALAYGVSVPHMFIVVFLVIGPIYWQTDNATLAWQAGMAWVFIEGLVELAGAFIGPYLRKITPRSAILGTLAGVSIALIAMRPSMQIWETPYIGFVSLIIILIGWFGNKKYPYNIPAGLVAIVVSTLIAWLTGFMSFSALQQTVSQFQFSFPFPWVKDLFKGFSQIAPYLATAIPLGIYNFFETMSNVESASAAGDDYNTREAMLVDGMGSIIGSIFGSVFPTAVYIGHPGWKKVGARIGYSIASGVAIFMVCILGVIPLLLDIIPLVALIPILLYIGLVIGSQAFQTTPPKHAPAIVVAIIPWLANWANTLVDNTLSAAGTSASELGYQALAANNIVYQGMKSLGSGAIITGMILGAIVTFIIENDFKKSAIYAFIAAVLSFFGVIHSSNLGFAVAGQEALAYIIMAVILMLISYNNRSSKN
ncbi:hypothetical protein [Halanaerobium sp. ST460_2HS_T2]|uniref:hypothetical protein n=1 Tax=Halanaerobium sp. ST460_2HS_T2 TaxID=2183914 RepID=UPI000DF1BF80|nr:hypothetical protein [Halanaerobium sp. ST460_2HS_T2]RCW62473.1 AGZA family xanthine/uracil permease-like MFS transporter [Halanaerobium sp. ST460_2HS_T2]